jgi:ketosteroid isomerase-like protein
MVISIKFIMKRLNINVFVVLVFSLISSGIFAQTREEIKAMVTKMNQEMIELIKAGRYESLGKYYDIDAISLPNYRAVEKGYKLILNNSLGRKQGGYQVLDGAKVTTDLVLGADMFVDIGSYTMTLNFPGLTQPKVDNGKYLNVWKKDKEGTWRIVAETWNADKSPNAPAQSKGQPARNAGTGSQTVTPGTPPAAGTDTKK